MKSSLLLAALLAAWTADTARGQLEVFNSGGAVGTIADGNPVGSAFIGRVSNISAGQLVGSLTLSLNIIGGYNGDFYASLVAPNGALVTLMDRPGVGINGFGASGAGMNITLQDGSGTQGSIQNVTSSLALSGAYNAAGSLASANGSLADGDWILYFADLSNGGGTSTLVSWSLEITTVPEPGNLALTMFGLALFGGGLVRRSLRKTQKAP